MESEFDGEEYYIVTEEVKMNTTSHTRTLPSYITIQFAWYSFIFTLGVIGNLYITLTVTLRKEMSSTTNYFIFNLAISDLGILLISLPAHIIRDYFSWSFGKIACQVVISMNDVFFSVSICTITVITLERYRAIVAPFKPRLRPKGGKITLGLIWLLSYLCVGFPMSFYMEVTTIDGRLICLPKWPSDIVFKVQTCFIGSLIVIPLCITAVAYTIMIKTMRRQSRRLREARERRCSAGIGSAISLRHVQERHRHDYNAKLVKMLIIIVVVFWICMLPLTILALVVEFFAIDPRKAEVDGLFTLSIAVFFSNSAFNPVAIYIMSSDLRKGLNTLLFFGRKRRDERHAVP